MSVPTKLNVRGYGGNFDPYHGTTTVGIVCKDGVVFATDTRVIQGPTLVAHKYGKKVHMIDKHVAITIAGGVADAQALIDVLRYQSRVYKLERNVPIPVSSIANFASIVMFRMRMMPLEIQALIGGIDHHGPSLVQLDPFGGLSNESFAATGSGSPVALGFLEANIKGTLTTEDSIKIAAQSVLVAMSRDTATGNDFDIAVIDKGGYKELGLKEKEEISKEISKRGTRF
ncbi:MAG: proteasome subunit beta [Thermoproteota archaeon]